MYKLVLVRHGQSQWNEKNWFTGWVDVDLTPKGEAEAAEAGKLLKEAGFEFDIAYTSVLKRAIHTLNIALKGMDQSFVPVKKSWRLNEKSYGALAGLNKAETAEKYGADQVLMWRRSFETRPPQVEPGHEYHPSGDRRYAELSDEQMTGGESLKDTVERTEPVLAEILADVKAGKQVVVAAHGNSLRAIIMQLEGMGVEEILKVNVPTGTPLVYELDENCKPIKHYYLGDQEAIKAAAEAVANQAKG